MATATKTATKATPKKKIETVVEETETKIDESNQKINEMSELILEQSKIIEMLKEQLLKPQQMQNVISLEGFDKVTVVHLKDYPTSIRLSNNKLINLNRLKQTQEITRSEALELVNSFPKAFEKGWITFSGEIGQEILETNAVKIDTKTINEIFNYKEIINSKKEDIVEFYTKLMPAQQDMFVSWWYNESASEDKRFLDIEVVNSLNKASDGRFVRLIGKITSAM